MEVVARKKRVSVMARRIVRAYKATNLAPLRGDYRGYVAVSVEQDDEEFHSYIYRKAAGPMAVLAIAEGGLVWGGGLEPRKPATSANIDAWIATQRGRHFWSGLIDSWDGCEQGEEYFVREKHG